MTMKEFYTAVLNIKGIDSEIAAVAQEQIEKIDTRNAKEAEKKAAEAQPLLDAIAAYLPSHPNTRASDVAIKTVGEEYKNKMVSLLGRLAREGKVTRIRDDKTGTWLYSAITE